MSNIYASPTPAAKAYSVSPSMTGAKPAVANKPPLVGRKPNRDVGSSDSGKIFLVIAFVMLPNIMFN